MSSGLKTGIGFRPGTRRSMRWIFFCPAIRPIVLCEHFRISAASAWVFHSSNWSTITIPLYADTFGQCPDCPYCFQIPVSYQGIWTHLDNVQIVKIRPHQRFRTQFRGVSACLRSSFAFSFEREATAPRQPFARSGPTRKPNAKIAQIADLAFSERNTSGTNETTERPQGMLEQSRGALAAPRFVGVLVEPQAKPQTIRTGL